MFNNNKPIKYFILLAWPHTYDNIVNKVRIVNYIVYDQFFNFIVDF